VFLKKQAIAMVVYTVRNIVLQRIEREFFVELVSVFVYGTISKQYTLAGACDYIAERIVS